MENVTTEPHPQINSSMTAGNQTEPPDATCVPNGDIYALINLLTIPVIVFAVVTNFLSQIIIHRQRARTSTSLYLMTVCAVDYFSLLGHLLLSLDIYQYTGTLTAYHKQGHVLRGMAYYFASTFYVCTIQVKVLTKYLWC